MALPIRFESTWRIRPGSPRTKPGTSASTGTASSIPLASAALAKICSVSSSRERRSKSSASTSSMPASIFEKSRMSLITCRSAIAERCIVVA
jgi:hypothetical protein